jgi:hypothetical protein
MNASTLNRMKKVEENGPVKIRTTDETKTCFQKQLKVVSIFRVFSDFVYLSFCF